MKPLSPELIRMLATKPAPQEQDIWSGDGAIIDPMKRGLYRSMEAMARVYSAAEQIPPPVDIQDSEGNTPVLINAGCPPWLCPPLWSVAVDFPVSECIPWYMVSTLMGTLTIPKGYLLVIKSVSYEAANAVQGDVIAFDLAVNNQPRAHWEDMVTDAAQPNPVHRFGLSGHIRELPLHVVIPPNAKVTVGATLLGAIDFNGVSTKWPGEPILTTDCHVKMLFNGWYFPAMSNVEGSPRQAFMGDLGNRLMEDS